MDGAHGNYPAAAVINAFWEKIFCDPALGDLNARVARFQEFASLPISLWRRGNKYLLARMASADALNRRDIVPVRTDNNCAIKNIVDGVLEKPERKMNISFLFFMPNPASPTGFAGHIFVAETGHVALDVAVF